MINVIFYTKQLGIASPDSEDVDNASSDPNIPGIFMVLML